VVRARKAIADDQIEDVHNELRQVRGVGRKIASFFLRDVALRFGLAPDTNRWLLQPVDLWIRRFTALLDADRGTSDRAVAEWVVTHSEVPELANAGLWYFGARIARRRLEWEEALGDPAVAEALVRRRVAGMEAAAAAWKARRGD
jgi:3-methyladenine DNA glycosylase/8-oxoguanine DNA glycosylase